MAFSTKLSASFGNVIEKSPYSVKDPIVKIQYIQKGNNVIFGRNISDETDSQNLLYLGKILEGASGKSYLGADAWLDTTYPHVVYITGTRGSGKSFDLGLITEGISELNEASNIQSEVTPLTSIIIDTQSQFWTLGFEPKATIPENAKQLVALKRWNISPNRLTKTKILVPPNAGDFLEGQVEIRLRPCHVSHAEWCALVSQDVYGPQGHVLAEALEALSDQNFELQDLIDFIQDDRNWRGEAFSSRNALIYKLHDYLRTGLFSATGLQIRDLLEPGYCHILMLRDIRNEDKALITAVIARQLFTVLGQHHNEKKKAQFFDKEVVDDGLPDKVWLIIDEAHVVVPKDASSPAREALTEYVKRGRDAGLSLVLATQQPSAVDDKILSQVNISINHRLTFQSDITAAINRIPTKTISSMKAGGTSFNDFSDMIRVLDSGQAFIGDHTSGRVMMVQLRPRVTAHGGYSPV